MCIHNRVEDSCDLSSLAGQPALTADPEDLYDEGNWTEGQGQSVKPPTSAAPGGPAEGIPQATLRLQNVPPGKILSLDQAIHFSIDCACEHTCIYTAFTPERHKA